MPGIVVDWKAEDAYSRLMAAFVASTDAKIDYTRIAQIYGRGANYNAIEGRFRHIRKEAAALKEEFEKANPEAAASMPATPVKKGRAKAAAKTDGDDAAGAKKEKEKGDKVVAGRVAKGVGKKAKGGGKAKGVVKEEGEGDDDDAGGNDGAEDVVDSVEMQFEEEV